MMSDDSIITIQTPDGSDFVTLPASDCDTTRVSDITVGDTVKLNSYLDDMSGDHCDTFTVHTHNNEIEWGNLFETPKEIKVGDRVLTSDMVEKLGALLDVIEGLDDHNALKELFNTQLGMNKIRGENENS